MKAVIVFTGTGPLLILNSYSSSNDPDFVKKLKAKGIMKFISFEVPIEQCKEIYGSTFDVIAEDLQKRNDLRVLDFDGHHIFDSFSLKKMGPCSIFEE
jgi:hypothetical protein